MSSLRMENKGVINRANEFWVNSKLSWLFQPWGGCCSSKDDDQLHSERSSMLPKRIQFLRQTSTTEDQEEFQFDDSVDGHVKMEQNKYELEESLEFNQDWLPEYNQNNSWVNSPSNLVIQAYHQLGISDQDQQKSIINKQVLCPKPAELDENEKPGTITDYADDHLTEDEMETDSKQSYVPSIKRKIIKKQKKLSTKINKKKKLFRNLWQPHEDEQLLQLVNKYGYSWSLISHMITGRSGKQVRDRYLNKLNPSINKGKWSQEEDETIVSLFYEKGSKWSEIAKILEGRTESQVKNRFYSYIRKRFLPSKEEGINQEFTNIIQSSKGPHNSDSDKNYKTANNTVIKNEDNSPMNINVPFLLNSINNQQNVFLQQNQETTVTPSLPNLSSPRSLTTVYLNDDAYNSYSNNQFEKNHNVKDFLHGKFQEDCHVMEDSMYNSYREKHELLNNGPEFHNLNPHYTQNKQKVNFLEEHPQNLLPSNINHNDEFIFINNNYVQAISVPNKEYLGLHDEAGSSQYSISSPETNYSNRDGEIDVRLDKLAILFEKNKLDLEGLKSIDTMSVVKSNNNSELMISETSHPLQKIERIDLLSKRTKKLEYLLAKTYQEINKISKQKNQQV